MASSGIVIQKTGKTVTQMLLGGVVLGTSLLLIIPSSIGIAEYNNRPLPVAGGIVDSEAESRLKAYRTVQIVILTIACIGVVLAVYLMATSDSFYGYVLRKAPARLLPTSASTA